MRSFTYTATDSAGRRIRARLDAADADAAIRALRCEGFCLTRLVEHRRSMPTAWLALLGATSLRQLALTARQCALLLSAGLTLAETLDTIQEQASGRLLQLALSRLRDAVLRGETLAGAMRRLPRAFPAFLCTMVHAGEVGGALAAVFERCARCYERELALRRKVQGALVYPGLVAVLAGSMAAFMLLFIVPQYAAFYSDFSGGEAQLPALTRRLVHVSEWLVRHWWVLPLTPLWFTLALACRRSRLGRLLLDPLALRLPVFGPLARRVACARFTLTLATLTQSGVPLLEALEVAQHTAGNVVAERAIRYLRRCAAAGESLSTAMRRRRVFPPLAASLLSAGEEAGSLELALYKLADYFDAEINATLCALAALVEPALMAALGLVVGTIVVALYQPFFNVVDVIK